MPVFNGENYLAEAIDSILAQTFEDFEIIISDNASTDGTEKICRDYAARDSRIRYIRQDRNLGAAPNYNKTYAMAVGEYFRWHAHDDVLKNTYLEKCVEALDRDPEVVLCNSSVAIIDENEKLVEILHDQLQGADSPRPSNRFNAALHRHKGTDFFALIRRKALEGTALHGSYPGSDKVLLAELVLRGRFCRIEEPLFLNRRHPLQFQKAVKWADRQAWFDSGPTVKIAIPHWRVWLNYAKAMRREVEDRGERLRCYFFLAEYWLNIVHLSWLRDDIIVAILGPRGTGFKYACRYLRDRFVRMKARYDETDVDVSQETSAVKSAEDRKEAGSGNSV